MTKLHFHTEAAIISKVQEALTVYNHIYQDELKAANFFRYVTIISDDFGEYC